MFLPEQDRYSQSKTYLESRISSLYGGRIAEELIGGKDAITTGASNDISVATDIARDMVTKWGFGEGLGPMLYSEDEGEVFLGRQVTQHKNLSDATARLIDKAIKKIIDDNYNRAFNMLTDNMDKLHLMANALMKYETIDSSQIDEIMVGKDPSPPEDWEEDDKPSTPTTKNEDKGEGKDKNVKNDSIGGEAPTV
jgi:cell division protease FtsH